MNLLDQGVLLLVSFVANLLSALAGGGAGLLQLPVLIFLGLAFTTALATHKIASVALGVGATLRHFREGTLNPGFSLFILGCGLPGVIAGAWTVLLLPEAGLKLALGLLTMGLAVYSFFKRDLGSHYLPVHRNPSGYAIGGSVLFGIGWLNGSLTSGTGLFVTLWLVRWFGLDYRQAVAYTLVLVGLFWNGTGALTLALQTPVQWSWLPALLAGSLLGGYAGAHLAITQGNRLIKRCYEMVTLVAGLSLVLEAY